MMKLNGTLSILSVIFCASAFAAEDQAKVVTFSQIKPHRENFMDKQVQIEGRVKDLKMIKEGGNKFATFFLSDPENAEDTVSVKVNLSKRKTVINKFECKDGQYTTVQGPFKSWGDASYLGKIEVRGSYEFKCSDNVQARKAVAAPEVAKKPKPKAVEKVEEKQAPVVKNDGSKPVILQIGSEGKITDANGKALTTVGATLEPGTMIKTGAHSFVQLKYPDGTKVSIGAKSKMVTESGNPGMKSLELKFGRINAKVHKQESQDIHFRVKTKSATMGVRGTQFFVNSTKTGDTSTHVINGRVDVASDDAALLAGKGKPVLHDEYVEVQSGKVSESKKFNAREFLNQMKAEQPELVAFADKDQDEPEEVAAADAPAETPAEPEVKDAPKEKKRKPRIAHFRVAGLGYLNKNSSAAFTGMLSWNPEIRLIGNWSIGLDAGVSNVKLGSAGRATLVEYALVGIFHFNSSLAAELKAGAQSFLSPVSATGAMGGLALRYALCKSCTIHQIILGDDILSVGGSTYNVARLGVGFKF